MFLKTLWAELHILFQYAIYNISCTDVILSLSTYLHKFFSLWLIKITYLYACPVKHLILFTANCFWGYSSPFSFYPASTPILQVVIHHTCSLAEFHNTQISWQCTFLWMMRAEYSSFSKFHYLHCGNSSEPHWFCLYSTGAPELVRVSDLCYFIWYTLICSKVSSGQNTAKHICKVY